MKSRLATVQDKLSVAMRKPDWLLLLFLLLFLNVKLVVKFLAIVFIYVSRPDFRFGMRLRSSRLPVFYVWVILIACINYLLYKEWNTRNYTPAWATGILFWILCLLATHQLKLAVERSTTDRIHATLFVFFLLNIIVSFSNLLFIIFETGALNPYRYQGLYQKYFIGTGDYIKGLSFDTSTTNAIINAFGFYYFLRRGRYLMVLCCMLVLLLTCSNLVNLLLVAAFGYSLLFNSTRIEKSIILISVCFLVLFMARVTPQNNSYAINIYQRLLGSREQGVARPLNRTAYILRTDCVAFEDKQKKLIAQLYIDSLHQAALHAGLLLTGRDTIQKTRPSIPGDNIHSAPFQHVTDHSEMRKQVLQLALLLKKDTATASQVLTGADRLPGKLAALQQTVRFLAQHPGKLLTGNGTGNYSSKLAFRTTGLKVAGSYPHKYIYISDDFKNAHLDIFLKYFEKDSGYHSVINTPNSVYAQMLGEYGLAGFFCLLVFYLGWFAKGINSSGYGIPLLLLTLGIFFTDYWFEQLSVLILFELLLFLQQKEKGLTT